MGNLVAEKEYYIEEKLDWITFTIIALSTLLWAGILARCIYGIFFEK